MNVHKAKFFKVLHIFQGCDKMRKIVMKGTTYEAKHSITNRI